METGDQPTLRLLLRHLEITEELLAELLRRSPRAVPEKLQELLTSVRKLREQAERQFIGGA